MTKYNIWIEKNNPYKCVFGARVDVDSKQELKDLENCIAKGIEEYEQHRD